MQFSNELHFAKALDKNDTIQLRNEFIIPQQNGKDAIYFLGNSLGLQPTSTTSYLQNVLETWGQIGVEGFFKGHRPWLDYHDSLASQLAPLVGALPQEVVVMNSLTVNLHLLVVSFYQPQGNRTKIICEAKAFPSDQYMLETHIRQRGLNPDEVLIEVAPKKGKTTIDEEDILTAIDKHGETVALVFWGGVNYYSGQLFNIKKLTEAAHAVGAKAGFDLAHAAGNVALDLHNWNVDFAAWCNYKYLNSGPGAVGAAYVHSRYHTDTSLQRFAGWWGYQKETRFQMQQGFVPVASAEGWALSTPSPLLFAAHGAALQLFEKAGMKALHQKGILLSSYLLYLLNTLNQDLEQPFVQVLTPQNEWERGCQVSMLMLQNGKQIFNYLTANGVFADWREPDVIRVAPVPLYNTFEEVWTFANLLKEACKTTA